MALIGSARAHFSEAGYADASLDKIAADVDFTRGAIYANFSGKSGLFLAVLDQRTSEQTAELDTVGTDLAQLGRWRRRTAAREEGLSLAVQEFRVIALRDDELREQLRERERRVRHAFATVIERAADQYEIDLPLPAADVAAVLLALGDGLTQQHQLDPDRVDLSLFETTLALLLGALDAGGSR